MIIRKMLPNQQFSKLDNKVWVDKRISDGAVRVYGYLCSLRNGANFTDKYICKSMGLSDRALYNRKSELKAAGLIYLDQIGPRVYVVYVGHSGMSASKVKAMWGEEDRED